MKKTIETKKGGDIDQLVVKNQDSFWPLKKRKARVQRVRSRRAVFLETLPQKNKLANAFLTKTKLKRRLVIKNFSAKVSRDIYEEYLIKMFLIEIDLGITPLPIIIEEPFSISEFNHLKDSMGALPKIIRFLLMYPFSAENIGEFFNIKLSPFIFVYKKNKNLWEFLNFCENFFNKEKKNKILKEQKKKTMDLISKPIFIKNILNRKIKNNTAQEKNMKLYGIRHKLIFNKHLKWRRYRRRKSSNIKLIIKKLIKKNQVKKYSSKTNISLIKLFLILNSLKENKKNEAIKNVQKNPLDFFYKKHLKEMEDYCFK